MSEQKMREILKKILVWDDGNLPGDILDEAREALAQQPAAVVELTDAHPMQPVVLVGEVARFKANPLVQHLLDNGGIDMNDLACLGFSREDQEHFAQLIGYSVSGFSTLSYASDEVCDKAIEPADTLIAAHIAKQQEKGHAE